MIANIISLLNMLLGFFSIILSIEGNFGIAGALILVATVLDLFDGRIARMIKKKNPYGKHLDTYADLITFCIAPSIMFYGLIWGNASIYPELKTYLIFKERIFGILISFLLPICGAYRLARFSENVEEKGGNYFTGLPTTFAGASLALILSFTYIPSFLDSLLRSNNIVITNFKLPIIVVFAFFLFYTYLMISNFKFKRAKTSFLNFQKGTSILWILVNLVFIAIIVFLTKYFLVVGALIYTLKPIIQWQRV